MNRRHFILGSALATRASAQPGDRVGTGMIGVGNRGSSLLSGVLEQPDARVIAVCDLKADRLDKAATSAAKDNPATYSDWQKLLDRKDIDSVFIATPPYLHAEMAVAALKAGKHVYLEKPVGVNAAQVRDVLRAARASNKVLHIGQQLRSQKQLSLAVQKIHEGAIGDILMVKAQRHASADLDHNGSSGDWYFNYAKSGGYLIEQSVHNLDLCNWVIGNHPLKAAGFGGTQLYKNDPPGRDIMDSLSLTYQYPKGVNLSFTQLVYHPRSMPAGNQYVMVYGSKGAVDLMGGTNYYPLNRDEQPSQLVPKQEEYAHAHVALFFECIQKGVKSNADIIVGATAALTAIMGSEACLKQQMIQWADLGVDV